MSRRTIQGAYSEFKMFAIYKSRFTKFYNDELLGTVAAGLALGERDKRYEPYHNIRLAVTNFAKDAGLWGPLVGQLQAAVMKAYKLGYNNLEPSAKCDVLEKLGEAMNLDSIRFGEGAKYENGLVAFLAFFGCMAESASSQATQAVAPAAEVVNAAAKAMEDVVKSATS
mgnify:CR=1 FL=1